MDQKNNEQTMQLQLDIKPEVASRMIMAPEHAKRLLMALQENVLKYEQTFGRIDLGTAEDQRMIPPIAPTSGEA